MTETTTGTHILLFGDADRKMGSVGVLLATLDARIVLDDEGHIDAEEGKPGELWVRGKTIMKASSDCTVLTCISLWLTWPAN